MRAGETITRPSPPATARRPAVIGSSLCRIVVTKSPPLFNHQFKMACLWQDDKYNTGELFSSFSIKTQLNGPQLDVNFILARREVGCVTVFVPLYLVEMTNLWFVR